MASGGYRPGAGRPRKSQPVVTTPTTAKRSGKKQSPLDYMLEVMNDAGTDPARRDRMAIAAAPFVHAKAEPEAKGAREIAKDLAKNVAVGKYTTPAPPKLVVNNE